MGQYQRPLSNLDMGIKKATLLQKRIAQQLGTDVSKDSFSVAAARILDIISPAIKGKTPKYSAPTQKQVEFAKQLGIDIIGDTFRVGCAKINDKLIELNFKAIKDMQLYIPFWPFIPPFHDIILGIVPGGQAMET